MRVHRHWLWVTVIFGSILGLNVALLSPQMSPAQAPEAPLRDGLAGFEFGMTPWQARDRCGEANWSFDAATDTQPLAEGRCGQAPTAYATFRPRSVRILFCASETGPPQACRFWAAGGGFHLRELLLQLTQKYGAAASREAGEELARDAECAEEDVSAPELEGEADLARRRTKATKAPRRPAKRPATGDGDTDRGPWEPERTCTRWEVTDNAAEPARAHRIEMSTRNMDGSFTMWETRLEYRAGGFEEAHRAAVEAIRERLRTAL